MRKISGGVHRNDHAGDKQGRDEAEAAFSHWLHPIHQDDDRSRYSATDMKQR